MEVTGISIAAVIAAGGNHTCARLTDYTVKCWGYNGGGQLGDGSQANRSTPVAVSGLTNAAALAAGGGHTCAVISPAVTYGTVKCWGQRGWGGTGTGQLGDGITTNTSSSTPVDVSGISTADTLTAGSAHTCARLTSGSVKCWGDDSQGQLGDGRASDVNGNPLAATPITVVGF